MKYALVQVVEPYTPGWTAYQKPEERTKTTRPCFHWIEEFDTLQEATDYRGNSSRPEWYKIIQVW